MRQSLEYDRHGGRLSVLYRQDRPAPASDQEPTGEHNMEQWAIFRNRETGEELAAYTIQGTFTGEAEATASLLAAENGLNPEQITVTIENRKSQIS